MKLKLSGVACLIVVFTLILCGTTVFAHRSGCHRWHSCPSDSGSYVCGDLGYTSECGNIADEYNSIKQPVYSSKVIDTEEVIHKSKKIINNTDEYEGYTKTISQGYDGLKKLTTTVNYTDGVESYRSEPTILIKDTPLDEVVEVGTRKKPTAYIDYISKSEDQGFWGFLLAKYDISASALPNNNFALLVNDRVISLGRSDSTGMLNFSGINFNNNDKLAIGTYSGGQFLWIMPSAVRISEQTIANTAKLTVLSEYASSHKTTDSRTSEKNIKECTEDAKLAYYKRQSEAEKRSNKYIDSIRLYYPEICDITI